MSVHYRICARCIMDTTDPDITFDDRGVCNHCRAFDEHGQAIIDRARSERGKILLDAVVSEIKAKGRNKEYDCITGVSGGVDSTYVAYKLKELGLRPLAVHFDSGWNSELAVNNIENIVKKLEIDLYTYVVDWEEMRDLQLAFFKASVANCDIPSDHAYLAALYRIAGERSIPYIISGGNAATEFILPKAWGHNAADLRHIKAIHKRFGSLRLRSYPTLGFWARYFYYPFIRGIKTIRLLDYMPYDKTEAKRLIAEQLGWRDYGGKHYESIFTRFFQAYYLPVKFGYDKRKAHLSSLIVSGQLSREQALEEMQQPTYPEPKLSEDKEFVAKKLRITVEEFDRILELPKKTHEDFPSDTFLFQLKDRLMRAARRLSAT